MRPHPRMAETDPSSPRAWATCDRCGMIYNLYKLAWQYDYRGTKLDNVRLLVCDPCYDSPQRQLGVVFIPPDPLPKLNARVEEYQSDEQPISTRYTMNGLIRVVGYEPYVSMRIVSGPGGPVPNPVTEPALSNIDPNWWMRFQLRGTNPTVALDFINGLYWDGTDTFTVPTTLLSGSPSITPGSGLLCNSTGVGAAGAFLSAMQGSAFTCYVETTGGTPLTAAGIVTASQDGSNFTDQILVQENTNLLVSFKLSTLSSLTAGLATNFNEVMCDTITNSIAGGYRALSVVALGSLVSPIVNLVTDSNTFTQSPKFVLLGTLGSANPTFNFGGFIRECCALNSALPSTFQAGPSAFTGPNAWWWNGSTSARIDYGNVLQYEYTQPWTVIAAIKLFNVASAGHGNVTGIIFSNVTPNAPFPGYELWIDGEATAHVRIINNFGSNFYLGKYGSTSLYDGSWHVVAATYDGSGLASGVNIYVDGVLETMGVELDALGGRSILGSPGNENNYQVGNQTNTNAAFPGVIGFYEQSNVVRSIFYISQFKINQFIPSVDGSTVLRPKLSEGGSSLTTGDQSSSGLIGTLGSTAEWLRG